ncbi:hypothetical protein Lal_00024558, partial [Lupinus albus]
MINTPAPTEPSLEELVRQMTMQNMQFQQETRASIQRKDFCIDEFLNIDIDIDVPCTSLYTCHACTDSELCDSCIDEFLNIVVDSPVQAATKPSFATFFPSVLQAPDWTPPFDLECDIAAYALGTVLANLPDVVLNRHSWCRLALCGIVDLPYVVLNRHSWCRLALCGIVDLPYVVVNRHSWCRLALCGIVDLPYVVAAIVHWMLAEKVPIRGKCHKPKLDKLSDIHHNKDVDKDCLEAPHHKDDKPKTPQVIKICGIKYEM